MARKLQIAFDIDGVLGTFDQAYETKLRDLGAPGSLNGNPPTQWHWEPLIGATGRMVQDCWTWIHANPDWWASHPRQAEMEDPEARTRFGQLCCECDVTITTHRPLGCRDVTRTWLEAHYGLPSFVPVVILIGRSKGTAFDALGIDYAVDDKFENFHDWSRAPDGALLIRRPWNTHAWDSCTSVSSTVAAIDLILGKV